MAGAGGKQPVPELEGHLGVGREGSERQGPGAPDDVEAVETVLHIVAEEAEGGVQPRDPGLRGPVPAVLHFREAPARQLPEDVGGRLDREPELLGDRPQLRRLLRGALVEEQ